MFVSKKLCHKYMKIVNRNRIKTLFVVTQSEFGGAQRYIFEITSRFDPQKYEILVAAGSPSQALQNKIWEGKGDGELFQKLKNVKVRPIHLKHLKRVPWPWQIFLVIREIYNLLKQERPNIIFLCSTTAGLLGSIAAKLIRNSQHSHYIIYRIGGWAFHDPRPFWQNKIIFWAEKLTAPLKDKVIVNSEIDREIAIKNKICPADKIVKIYNGIDLEKLEFLPKEKAREILLRQETKDKRQEIIIGTVANFYKTKGLEYLIKAARCLKFDFKQRVIFVVIGEGHRRPELEGLIKKYNLGNNFFLPGRIPNAYKYLKAFDIFVLPSLKEGFPWIILEAMAAELPIVATKVGALPEIIEDRKEGILIEPKNSQELAEKTLWLLNHPKKAQEMESRAKEKLKKFTLEKMVRKTGMIINDRK